jgi:hypothetical protein
LHAFRRAVLFARVPALFVRVNREYPLPMRLVLRTVAALLGVVVVVLVLQGIASESGEVVVLSTVDAAGAPQETRLWIVDHQGAAWLRAGSSGAGWYARLREQPRIHVERDGVDTPYQATPVPEATIEINRLMAAKYGWADRFVGLLFSRDDAVAVRLDPALD